MQGYCVIILCLGVMVHMNFNLSMEQGFRLEGITFLFSPTFHCFPQMGLSQRLFTVVMGLVAAVDIYHIKLEA